MSIVPFPGILTPPAPAVFSLQGGTVTGGRSLTGAERTRAADAPWWRLTLPVRLSGSAEVLAWRAFVIALDGRANQALIPVCECGRSPMAVNYRLGGGVPHSDGAPFSDGSLYSELAYRVSPASSYAARSTSMVLNVASLPVLAPEPGMLFTVDNRLYMVRTAAAPSGATVAITFAPPLRAAVTTASIVRFDEAKALFELADDAAAWPSIGLQSRAEFSVSFIEAL
jgi:hypothetical protein